MLLGEVALFILPIAFYNFFAKMENKRKLNVGILSISAVLFTIAIFLRMQDRFVTFGFLPLIILYEQITIYSIVGIYYSFFHDKFSSSKFKILIATILVILELIFLNKNILENVIVGNLIFAGIIGMLFMIPIIIFEKIISHIANIEEKKYVFICVYSVSVLIIMSISYVILL